MKWKAYAKLNLALDITGRREDGYHLIDTILQEITLCDDLTIEPAESISVDCPGIPADDNIARKAAEIFFRAANIGGGARIRIDKHIPVGAGLGGGSSDAASVLCALNHIYGHPLTRSELMNAAIQLGADVPACINGGTQRAQGIGDIVSRIPNRCRFLYLLVKPEQSIVTARAYELYDSLPKEHFSIGQVEEALRCSDRTAFRQYAGNALLGAAQTLVPVIADAGQRCLDEGAVFWSLTGSGSCVFSIFRDEPARSQAKDRLSRAFPFVCEAEGCDRETTGIQTARRG